MGKNLGRPTRAPWPGHMWVGSCFCKSFTGPRPSSFVYTLSTMAASCFSGRVETVWPESLKYLLPGSLQKRCVDPLD